MRSLPYLAVAACAALLAWHAHGWLTPEPERVVRTDTLRVEADAPEPEEGDEPTQRRVYDRQDEDETQDACFSLPQQMPRTDLSITGPLPVSIEGRTVTLTRYETQTQRYVQDVYRTRRPRWAATLDAYAGADTYTQEVGVSADLRYKGVTLTTSLGVQQADRVRLLPGIRIRTQLMRWTHE